MYSIHFVLWPTILYHWLTLCQKLTFVRPLKNFLLVFQIHSPPTLTICLLRLPCLLFCLSNLKSPFEIGIVSSGSSSSSLTSPVSVSTSGGSFLFCSKDKIQVLMTKNYFFIVKEVLYEVRCLNQLKTWSSHLLDNLSNCLLNLKNSGDSTGFEPMTSAMPVQCSNQLSYEVTQLGALLSHYIPFTGKHEPNILTCSQLCDFIAQLVRALHRHRRGHGFESR